MKKLLVQAGNLKNKSIITTAYKKYSNFTPSIVKKSVFSLVDSFFINSQLDKKENFIFVDLFSGSGQMGVEAISRGFQKSVFFEISRIRFSILKKQISFLSQNFEIYNKDSFRYYKKIRDFEDKRFIYFLDPPYSFWEYNLNKLQDFGLLPKKLLQYFSNYNSM